MNSGSVWNLANVWEVVTDTIPLEPAIISDTLNLSWQEYELAAACMAQTLVDAGLEPGSKVAIYSYNRAEYLIAQFGALKARLCPVNVNYRYLEAELAYIIDNSDAEAVVYESAFASRLEAILSDIPAVKVFVEIDPPGASALPNAISFEHAISGSAMPRIEREASDVYMLYTGGTTGNPKGVMYEQGGFAKVLATMASAFRGLPPPETPADLVPSVKEFAEQGTLSRSLPACPLMHGTGMWIGVFIPQSLGAAAVIYYNQTFDPNELMRLVERERVQELVIVGDAFAKPIVDALDKAVEAGTPMDLSPVRLVGSSGVMFSASVKQGLLRHMDANIVDSMGASEGSFATSITNRENVNEYKTARFELSPFAKVLKEDGTPVTPGSGEMGLICSAALVPVGYYKDPVKSASTFKEFDGVRYSVPGDYATVEADGTITLIGRGSICINSGGEKIYPEEVEEAMKAHTDVYDCLVVGVADDKFGQAVTAVYSAPAGAQSSAELKAHVRGLIADYKAPRHYVWVDAVPRAVNGKADYKTAKKLALQALGIEEAAA
ncbi:MAG: AMP-binding protein [Halieaceae bacterium]|nr:AMP-binding protein [Halieaceae bacterium]